MAITATSRPSETGSTIKVMVVDDSAVVRGLITRFLSAETGIEVVATCSNGVMAIQQATRIRPDIVVLDVEMPVMDGLTAVSKLLEVDPSVRIIMASTLTQRNAKVSIDALARGAADYIPKPTTSSLSTSNEFRCQLLEKVLALGRKKIGQTQRPASTARAGQSQSSTESGWFLRKARPSNPKLLVIGSSTGGPQALSALLAALSPKIRVPILVAQHMPATFTAILAQHIARASGRPCAEAIDKEEMRAGNIYVAPGDFHLEVAREGTANILRLTQAPPENFCRPSVNPLFRSAARFFGADVCAVMLTGMGADGLDGTRDLARTGAPVVAQDEASCVVWGMPGAIATAGLCTAVLPLTEIAAHLAMVIGGGQR